MISKRLNEKGSNFVSIRFSVISCFFFVSVSFRHLTFWKTLVQGEAKIPGVNTKDSDS